MSLTKEDAEEAKDLLLKLSLNAKELDSNLVNRRAAVAAGRDLLLVNMLGEQLEKTFKKGYVVPNKYNGKKANKIKRILNLVVSDTHFQSLLDPQEVPVRYHAQEESRRLGRVAQQAADYKRQYRPETKLMLHLLGDIIQNMLHDPRDGAPLITQCDAAIHYIVQLILFLSSQFPEVEVNCTPGNHGRNMARHHNRAVFQKWDAIETLIYKAVKHAIKTSGVKNVTINIGKLPYYTVQLFDSKGFFTHGDTVLKPGYPGKNIDTKGLYQQICRWNAARNIGGPFNLFCCGHVHFGSITNMPGNVVMVTNGCLIPPDSYSLSIGAPDVTCGQYMFESVEGHVIGDQRFIVVDDADSEAKYNDIIKPYGDL